MSQTPYARPIQSRPRAVHMVLRDGDTVDGGIYLTDGQALAPYLGSRKNGWVNIVNAKWGLEGELHGHAVVQAEHVLMAMSTHRDYPIVAATQGGAPRAVDLLLEDGTRLQGNLVLGSKQRLSDYLAGAGTFLALMGAVRVQDGETLGDIAVNAGCVKAVRDAKVFEAEQAAEESRDESWGGMLRTATIAAPTAPRRLSAPGTALTVAEAKRAHAIERHWLVQLARDAQLTLPDCREVSDACTLAEIWHQLAQRNDMAQIEIAVMIAAAYKLELANFDEVTAPAIKSLPAKLARRLGIVPVRIEGRALVVATSDPESLDIEQQVAFASKHDLKRVIAAPEDIAGALAWYYPEMVAAQA